MVPEHEAWATRRQGLEDTGGEICTAVHEVRESRRANPSGLLKSLHRILNERFNDLAVSEVRTFHRREPSDILAAAMWEEALDLALNVQLCEPLTGRLQATAQVVRAWEDDAGGEGAVETAREKVAAVTTAVAAGQRGEVPSLAPGLAVARDLQRILAALLQRCPDSHGPHQWECLPWRFARYPASKF